MSQASASRNTGFLRPRRWSVGYLDCRMNKKSWLRAQLGILAFDILHKFSFCCRPLRIWINLFLEPYLPIDKLFAFLVNYVTGRRSTWTKDCTPPFIPWVLKCSWCLAPWKSINCSLAGTLNSYGSVGSCGPILSSLVPCLGDACATFLEINEIVLTSRLGGWPTPS